MFPILRAKIFSVICESFINEIWISLYATFSERQLSANMKALTSKLQKRSRTAALKKQERDSSRAVQRDKIRWLVGKRWSPSRIHEALSIEFGRHAYSYKCVVYHCSAARRKVARGSGGQRGRPRNQLVDEKILLAHAEDPDLSAKKLAVMISEPRETVRRHLIQIGGNYGNFPRVPHELTESQKSSRVKMSKTLLDFLKDKKKWPKIITGDETWVYATNSPKRGWTLPGDAPRTRVDAQQGDQKVMLQAFFSSRGFKSIRFLDEGSTVDANFCCDVFREIAEQNKPPLWIHMDNARPHRAKKAENVLEQLSMVPLPHPPYSPDLAPADFWLFGRMKNVLGSTKFLSIDKLQERVVRELHKIQLAEFRRVYNEWILRLQLCIEMGGEYVHTTL